MCGFKSSHTLDEEIIQRYEDKGLVGENTTEDYEGCKITIIKNGPMHVLGKVDLHVDKWSTNANQQKYSLCRCGTSENKPFCDYTHTSLKMKNYTF